MRSSWQSAIRKLSSFARVNIALVSAWVEEVATAVCLTLRLWKVPEVPWNEIV